MKTLVFIVGLCACVLADAREKAWPEFEMAFAGDQPEINSESITAEASQIRSYLQWRRLQDDLEEAQLELEHKSRQLERAEHLNKEHYISFDDYTLAKYEHLKAKNHLTSLQFQIQQARAAAEFHRLKVIDKGSKEVNFLLEMSEASLIEKENERDSLSVELETMEYASYLATRKLVKSEKLLKERILSEAAGQDRKLAADLFAEEVESLKKRISDLDMIIKGLERNVARLSQQASKSTPDRHSGIH